ncbi:ABC transporter permease [Tardisphaera miroshnichenkoae]
MSKQRSLSERFKDVLNSLYVSVKLITSTTQGKIGFTIFAVVVIIALIAPIFPYPGPRWQNTLYEGELPSTKPNLWYILGGDYLGSPMLLDIIWGLQYFMIVGLIAAILTVGIGVVLGLLAGYLGGWVDMTLNFVFNILLTIPSFALWLILAIIFRNAGPVTLGFILGILSWAGLARAIRSVAISNKAKDFVEASRALGLSSWSIISNDIMPAIMPYVFMNFMLSLNGGIYGSMGLAFLGILPYTTINWGVLVNVAIFQQASVYTWKGTVPLLIIMVISTVILMGFIFTANASDRLFDPQKRKEAENMIAASRNKK